MFVRTLWQHPAHLRKSEPHLRPFTDHGGRIIASERCGDTADSFGKLTRPMPVKIWRRGLRAMMLGTITGRRPHAAGVRLSPLAG